VTSQPPEPETASLKSRLRSVHQSHRTEAETLSHVCTYVHIYGTTHTVQCTVCMPLPRRSGVLSNLPAVLDDPPHSSFRLLLWPGLGRPNTPGCTHLRGVGRLANPSRSLAWGMFDVCFFFIVP
jgi:hypothetical protein